MKSFLITFKPATENPERGWPLVNVPIRLCDLERNSEYLIRSQPYVVAPTLTPPQPRQWSAGFLFLAEIQYSGADCNSEFDRAALAIGARGYVCKSHIASDLVDAVRAAGQIRTLPGSS